MRVPAAHWASKSKAGTFSRPKRGGEGALVLSLFNSVPCREGHHERSSYLQTRDTPGPGWWRRSQKNKDGDLPVISLFTLFSEVLHWLDSTRTGEQGGGGVPWWSCCKSAFLCRARKKWVQSRSGGLSNIPSTRGREKEKVEATSLGEQVRYVGEGRAKTYCSERWPCWTHTHTHPFQN